MRKLGLLFGCIFTSILLTGCCSCPCSEKTESINKKTGSVDKLEFEVNDFDSAITAFYNGGSFTCDFSGDIEERFMDGYIAVDENRLSVHANWRNKDFSDGLLTGEGYLIIKNGLLFEWSKENDEVEGEVDEGGMEDIVEILHELRDEVKDGTGAMFLMDCKAGIKESDFIVPSGIYFDY